jgi:hypothetical protein
MEKRRSGNDQALVKLRRCLERIRARATLRPMVLLFLSSPFLTGRLIRHTTSVLDICTWITPPPDECRNVQTPFRVLAPPTGSEDRGNEASRGRPCRSPSHRRQSR